MNPALGLAIAARPGWTDELPNLVPGAHVAVLADDAIVGIEGRLAGLHLRDTILVLRAGPTTGFVFLFRAPMRESTVAGQALATGTGGMNIDACRVGTTDKFNRAPASSGFSGISGYALGSGRMSDSCNVGRWPTNMVLVHGPGCRNVGTTKIRDRGGISRNTALGLMNDDGRQPSPGRSSRPVGEDSMETVAAWECEGGCPVPTLDGQSGITTSGAMKREVGAYEGTSATQFLRGRSGPSNQHGDSGGASRFFAQFKDEDEMRAWIERLIVPVPAPSGSA